MLKVINNFLTKADSDLLCYHTNGNKVNLINKSKLRNGTKAFLETKFFSIQAVKFKKLRFSAPLKR